MSLPKLNSHLTARKMEKHNGILGGHGAQIKIPLWWERGRLCHSRAVGKDPGSESHSGYYNSGKRIMLVLRGKCGIPFAHMKQLDWSSIFKRAGNQSSNLTFSPESRCIVQWFLSLFQPGLEREAKPRLQANLVWGQIPGLLGLTGSHTVWATWGFLRKEWTSESQNKIDSNDAPVAWVWQGGYPAGRMRSWWQMREGGGLQNEASVSWAWSPERSQHRAPP